METGSDVDRATAQQLVPPYSPQLPEAEASLSVQAILKTFRVKGKANPVLNLLSTTS
jgi:hypothetical protein